MDRAEFNRVIREWQTGQLHKYSTVELQSLSAGCVVYVQQRIRPATELKQAIDDEIRRKEAAAVEQRAVARDREKIDGIKNLDGKVASIDGRLIALEREASRSEFRKLGFWVAALAIFISLVALLRDYWGWSLSRTAPVFVPQSASPTNTSGSSLKGSSLSQPSPALTPAQPSVTNVFK
jgi:hypothetical protein